MLRQLCLASTVAGGVALSCDAQAASIKIVATQNIGQAFKSPLIQVGNTVFGTATTGPAPNTDGVVFEVDLLNGRAKVLYGFKGGSDGALPWQGSPLIAVNGALIGTTSMGGDAAGDGVVFSVDGKTGVERVLYRFAHGRDGASPEAPLVQAGSLLYGTTYQGGSPNNFGTIYSIDPVSGGETIVYRFAGGHEGANPQAALTLVDGVFYSTTAGGGMHGGGTLYAFDPTTGAEHVIHEFGSQGDGQQPNGLTQIGNFLYGTTYAGGAYGAGTVFKVDRSSGAETVIYSFTGGNDGAGPQSALLPHGGLLYGTTTTGGIGGAGGVIYTIDPTTGAEQTIYSFKGKLNGSDPNAELAQINSTLYGTAAFGGTTQNCGRSGCGLIFKFQP